MRDSVCIRQENIDKSNGQNDIPSAKTSDLEMPKGKEFEPK
jgi:hypothetical protein